MRILIKNGRVINPKTNIDTILDVLIEDNTIKEISTSIENNYDKIIDAKGMWVVPGLIDVHVHLREPGFEYKESIETGSKSAAKGGFTTVCAMPNTNPVVDNEIIVEYIKLKAEKEAVVNVLPVGAITKGQKGEELANIGKMKEAGICAISEDGRSVMDAAMLKKAMIYANMFSLPVLSHCEDDSLAGSGSMNAGETSTILGLKGIPAESEDIIVSRDIILAEKTKAKLHLCHVSTKGSVELIRMAKAKGNNVTAEVCPHHFTLTDKEVLTSNYNTNTKMNPPLRSEEDLEAIIEGLKDGTLDIIATDHAPHHIDEKNCEFENAANGIVGLETAVGLTITKLVETKIITPMDFVSKLSLNPAKMLGIETEKGSIEENRIADITIINPEEEYIVNLDNFETKGKNTPFNNWKLKGKVKYTIVNGKIVYRDK